MLSLLVTSLFVFGMGTGPADHLACQESSRCSMNVTSVLVQRTVTGSLVSALCPGLALREML